MWRKAIIVALFLQLGLGSREAAAEGCVVDFTTLKPEMVVVYDSNGDFVYPGPSATNRSISLLKGEVLLLSCPESLVTSGQLNFTSSITVTCESGSNFTIKQDSNTTTTVDFSKLKCLKRVIDDIQLNPITIGFNLNTTFFRSLITIDFDSVLLNPRYSSYVVKSSIGVKETQISNIDFTEDEGIYNLPKKVDDLYEGQESTINTLLGLSPNNETYINRTTNFLLSRGHLAAKADFVYAPQQLATFHYVNAAPQWQTLNGGNWQVAEGNVRDYAEKHAVDLTLYTGTYGISSPKHRVTNNSTRLYLYVDNNVKKIPVPDVFWKVVYEPVSKKGVVFVGINNAYADDISTESRNLCTDVTKDVTWITWKTKKDDITVGIMYACDINEFRKKVDYLPKFEVIGLLT